MEEHETDFRVPGLSHAVVKEAEHLRIQELVKKIESHLHREALQADLHQNNVYNPFSNNSKATIQKLGNVKLLELCETFPKVHCSHCLLFFGIKELCTAFADISWLTANPEGNSTNYDWDALRDKERTYPWCSTRQDQRTNRVPYGPECVEEMLQESRLSR